MHDDLPAPSLALVPIIIASMYEAVDDGYSPPPSGWYLLLPSAPLPVPYYAALHIWLAVKIAM